MRWFSSAMIALAALAGSECAQMPGSYAPVNDLKIYYEIHGPETGKSPPLVLLHGGVGGIEMFGPTLPALASNRRVIAVDLQAHGRTSDTDRPLRFELLADDIAELMKHLQIQRVDVMGYSLGGGVALQTAIRHSSLVRRLVIVSAPFNRNGWYPEVLASMEQMGPAAAEGMKQSPSYKLYPNVDWSRLFTKLGDLLRRDYDWSNDVAAIRAPTMLVFADADAVRATHIMEFYRLLGGGRRDAGVDGSGRPAAHLAVLPGVTHYAILSSAMVAEVVTPFLDSQTTNER